MRFSDFRIRDPYIIRVADTYYLTGSELQKGAVELYCSRDLKNWETPVRIFSVPEDFWAKNSKDDIWAPEIHAYRGKFYLFVSLLGKNGLRGTQVAVCDRVDGTYTPVGNAPSTPLGQSCIDGTFYEEDGVPYIVYSHDWPDHYLADRGYYEGEICAARLKADLSGVEGEPWVLFGGATPKWAKSSDVPSLHSRRYGTDGPFLHRQKDGTLMMLWSPMHGSNYIVAAAVSDNGSIHGNWSHLDGFIYDDNGGHGMLFDRPDGQLMLCLHTPERWNDERAAVFAVREIGETLEIVE